MKTMAIFLFLIIGMVAYANTNYYKENNLGSTLSKSFSHSKTIKH